MVESGILPIRRIVAGLTLRSEFSVMFIILSVAGIAIFWRAFEDIIHMAFFAGDFGMFAFKLECGEIMVEDCIFPSRGIMTALALRSVLTIMFIILSMAGIAILWQRL